MQGSGSFGQYRRERCGDTLITTDPECPVPRRRCVAGNGRDRGALQTTCGSHLNGRFPNSTAQKQSSRNPLHFKREQIEALTTGLGRITTNDDIVDGVPIGATRWEAWRRFGHGHRHNAYSIPVE